jgi:hypothetical protein
VRHLPGVFTSRFSLDLPRKTGVAASPVLPLWQFFLRQPENQAAASMTKKCLLSTSKMAGFDKVRFFLSVIDNKLDFPPVPS